VLAADGFVMSQVQSRFGAAAKSSGALEAGPRRASRLDCLVEKRSHRWRCRTWARICAASSAISRAACRVGCNLSVPSQADVYPVPGSSAPRMIAGQIAAPFCGSAPGCSAAFR
jgi:hypothetical protein